MEKEIELKRHSLAHLMAAAVLRLYPQAKFGIGPVIENGFYYDIDLGDITLSPEDLPKIQKLMKEMIKEKIVFEKQEFFLDEAVKIFKVKKQDYKLELLKDLKEKGTTVISEDEKSTGLEMKVDQATIYTTGEFVDLCRGPHVEDSKKLKSTAFKLTKLAGAYWRGDEHNKMLTRIYAVAFETKEELKKYLDNLAEAEKRDHRKLGKALDLFVF
ncbi:threonine--tRNA ligase, partial [bacterium]|nr:threonine--tRNA ligase [bacterium]